MPSRLNKTDKELISQQGRNLEEESHLHKVIQNSGEGMMGGRCLLT